MKKIIICIFLLFSVIGVVAEDFDILFSNPKVKTEYHYHILQNERPETIKSVENFKPSSYLLGANSSLMNYKRENLYLSFNYKLGTSFNANDSVNYYNYFYGATLKGNLKDKLIFFSDWWKVQFSKSVEDISPPLQDSWNEKKSIDNSNTVIKYFSKDFGFYLGRSKFQIGSGISGSVILSDVSDEYAFIASDIKMGKFKFSIMHSALIPDSVNIDYAANETDPWGVKYEDKFLALHKVDYQNNGLHLFLGEEVVYGSRSIDLNYILPLAFWRAVEHNLGDRDNMLMFFGFDWSFKKTNIIYFNFNLDDLFKSKIFTSFWGNKYALQLGYRRILSNKIKFTNEVVAIRPWTYTHKRVVNVFSNNKKPLGFPYGSNLIANICEVAYLPIKSLKLVAQYSFVKQGSTGNNFTMNYLQVGDQTIAKAKWLDGDINTINMIKLSVDYSFLRFNKIYSSLEYYKDNDKKDTRISVQYQIKF